MRYSAGLDDFKPAGTAWATPLDTGGRALDPITATFKYDGAAAGPAVKCALGTSSTLLITQGTGQSVTGTWIASDVELVVTPDKMHGLAVTFTPTGTQTIDYAE